MALPSALSLSQRSASPQRSPFTTVTPNTPPPPPPPRKAQRTHGPTDNTFEKTLAKMMNTKQIKHLPEKAQKK